MEKNMSKMAKSKYIIYGLGVSYFMIDQIYNQWLSYYYLPPETEKNLVPLLKPQYLVLAFIFARIIDAVSDPVVGFLSDNSKSCFGKRSIFIEFFSYVIPSTIFDIVWLLTIHNHFFYIS